MVDSVFVRELAGKNGAKNLFDSKTKSKLKKSKHSVF